MNLPVITSPVASNQQNFVSDTEASSPIGNFGYQRKLKKFMKSLEKSPNSFTDWWTKSDLNTDKNVGQTPKGSVLLDWNSGTNLGLGTKHHQDTLPQLQGPSLHFASALRSIHSKSSLFASAGFVVPKSRRC